ncbi:trihelix transcription factor GT-2-like [Quillaja saponaria]|uniref:Trihelix transcription factor GT-2-like n=1 Tax=Quillaja saponaria TaxID=32244 RepID=A0AAD7PVX5_QUISA|nr:trihelix transcription factor GT-2-like [Quillaja saponaria]
MLGDSTSVLGGSSGDDAAAAVAAATAAAASARGGEGGGESTAAAAAGVGSNSGDEDRGRGEDGERNFGGNRWPRQETLALLKIRSDMDVAFRDASVKGPLWEEVSRKLAELGYSRSAKKCKEKFENVYKYHKRTKEGRTGKTEGKTYRFFDQLEALDQNHPGIQSPTPISSSKPHHHIAPPMAAPPPPPTTTTVVSMPSMISTTPIVNVPLHVTVPSTTNTVPMTISHGIVTPPTITLTIPSYQPPSLPPISTPNPSQTGSRAPIQSSFPNIPTELLSNSSSSSTSSDELDIEGRGTRRKRKWKDFFGSLMKEVIEKQELLQKRFLEAIEKREHERMVREEAWRAQEMARINREREILAQERSIAAAKDSSVMAFLQKIAEQRNLGQALNNINIPQPAQLHPQSQPPQQLAAPPLVVQHFAPPLSVIPPPQQAPPQQPAPLPSAPQKLQQNQVTNLEITRQDNGDKFQPASSSRWPKVEVEALIELRKNLDSKYQENGPKGPLWEEISAAMKNIGYNRNAKRCKEKWENINKYFKKVKESNKKRPEDSKTCPYFHQLDALYREKNKYESSNNQLKPEDMMTPLMVRPEQQWPPQQDTRQPAGHEATMEDVENEPINGVDDDEDYDKDGDGDGDEDEEEDEGCENYEIVASKPATSVGAAE